MPVLTDRQEPEDFDKETEGEEPNEYAIKYLFKPRNSPGLERQRTGRTLIYSGAAANLLATVMILVALELKLPWQLLVFMVGIIGSTGLVALRLWKQGRNSTASWLVFATLVLLGLGIADSVTLDTNLVEMGNLLLYLPGTIVMFASNWLLLGRASSDS